MPYQLETEDGQKFEFEDGTPEEEAFAFVDQYEAKPVQDSIETQKTFGSQLKDWVTGIGEMAGRYNPAALHLQADTATELGGRVQEAGAAAFEDPAAAGLEFAAGANRGVTQTLDMLPSLFNAVSEVAGSDVRAQSVTSMTPGTEGGFMPEGDARAAIETGGEFFGGSWLGTLGVFGTAGRARAGAQGAAGPLPVGSKSVRASLGETARRNPDELFKREMAQSGLFAGGGAAGSALSEDDEMVSLAGGLIAATRGAPVRFAGEAGKSLGRGMRQAFSKKAARERAFKFISSYADNPKTALRTLRDNMNKGKTGTLAQMSEDKGIAAVENRLIKNSPTEIGERVAVSDEKLSNSILDAYEVAAGPGVPGQASDFMKARVARGVGRVNAVVQKAKAKAASELERAGTPLETQDASRALSSTLDDVERGIKQLEDDAWSKIDSGLRQDTSGVKKAVNSVMQQFTPTARRASGGDLNKAFKLVKALGGRVHPRELADLRSELTSQLWQARDAKKSSTTIKALDDMQKAVLRELDSSDTSSAYREAIAITKEKHKLLYNGLLGDARRKATTDDLGARLMRSGDLGGPVIDEMKAASQVAGVPVDRAAEDMLRSAFVHNAVDRQTGEVIPAAAEQFMRKYKGTINRFPRIAQELGSVQGAQRAAQRVAKAGQVAQRNIEKSRAAMYSEFEDPRRAVEAVISRRTKQPAEALDSLLATAMKDKTGAAVTGLKRDVVDTILDRMTVPQTGGAKIKSTYAKEWEQLRPALEKSKLFGPEEMAGLNAIVRDIDRYYIRRTVPAIKENVQEDVLATALGQIAGARIGARFGTTPLIAAGLGRKFAQKVMQKMPRDRAVGFIEDMVLHPENFDDFARKAPEIETTEQALQALNSWAIAAGMRPIAEPEIQRQLEEEAALTLQ